MKKNLLKTAVCGILCLCTIILCACGNIKIEDTTFIYDHYSTEGYEDLTQTNIDSIHSFIPAVTSEQTLVNYIVGNFNNMTFKSKKAGTFNDISNNFDYYRINKNNSELVNKYWRYYDNLDNTIQFVTISSQQLQDTKYYIYKSDDSDIDALKLNIAIITCESEGNYLKAMVEIEIVSNNPAYSNQFLNYNFPLFYKAK